MSFSSNEYAIVIARAWSDTSFAKLLQSNPAEALGQLGLRIGEGVKVNFLFNSENTLNLVIPVRPDGLTQEDIEAAQRGAPELLGPTPVSICTGPPTKNIC